MNKIIHQDFQVSFQYSISFTQDIFNRNNHLLAKVMSPKATATPAKAVVILDQGMYACHPQLIEKVNTYFAHHTEVALQGEPLVLQGGEAVKNSWKPVEAVLELVNTQKIDRHSYIIAVGGGAFLDAVGLAATLAHRGVRLVRVPTTVLSQNDSGVGVKNAINYFGKKNFLGTFQPPVAVINDALFLTTLSDRDWRSGISEAIKVALIKDAAFFDWIEQNTHLLNARDLKAMETLVFRCAELHTEHIGTNGDPFEKGSSRPLDFGHWAAHKLEDLSDFALTHGEAVAIGIALDACYSFYDRKISAGDLHRILNCFLKLGFAIHHPLLAGESVKQINPKVAKGLGEFREHLGGQLTVMLLANIGKGVNVHELKIHLLDKAVAHLFDFQLIEKLAV
jgi:3-dehydroquinate synthase